MKLWNEMKLVDLEMFETFFTKASEDKAKIVYDGASFEDFTKSGKAMMQEGEKNGPCRVITDDGTILISTYKANSPHGLSIGVKEDEIHVYVRGEGSIILYLVFDHEGNETRRVDSDNNFPDVARETFFK